MAIFGGFAKPDNSVCCCFLRFYDTFLPVKTGIIVYILSFLAYPLVSSPRWAVNMEKCSVSLELSKLYTTPCPSAASKSHKRQQKPPQRQAPASHTSASRNPAAPSANRSQVPAEPRSAKRQQATETPAAPSAASKPHNRQPPAPPATRLRTRTTRISARRPSRSPATGE